jgi:hypothetical protein
VKPELEPTPAAIATIQDQLRPHLHNPARYWPTLVEYLIGTAEYLDWIHGKDCTTTDCRTCETLADLTAAVEAHDLLQPSGCACTDHITYPVAPGSTAVGAAV